MSFGFGQQPSFGGENQQLYQISRERAQRDAADLKSGANDPMQALGRSRANQLLAQVLRPRSEAALAR